MIVIPICLSCIHCKKGMLCKIYPNGIPHEILSSQKAQEHICNYYENKRNVEKASE